MKLARTRKLMCESVPDCLVTGCEPLMSALSLPDDTDPHVLAAAIRCSAQVIVTTDAAAFPAASVEPFNIEAQSPDEFVLDLVDLAPACVAAVVQQESSALRTHPRSAGTLLDDLSSLGLPRTAAARPSTGEARGCAIQVLGRRYACPAERRRRAAPIDASR